MHRSAVVLFTGSVSRESRQKGLPATLLPALHASLAQTIESLPSVDLIRAHDFHGAFHLEGARVQEKSGDSTLAAKIALAVQAAFAARYERVILLAGDIAGLTADSLQLALSRITDSTPVLGRSGDGGFYLLGLARTPDVDWNEIAWRTPRAAASLHHALSAAGLHVLETESIDDIDDRAAAERAARQLLARGSFRALALQMQSWLALDHIAGRMTVTTVPLRVRDVAATRGPPPQR